MKTTIYRLIMLLLCLLVGGVSAQQADLYSGEVAVPDESVEARNEALSRILAQVMVRVSGRSDIASGEAARKLLQEAPALAQQFRYRSVPAPADEVAPPTRYLEARFDPAALQRLMAQYGLPVWTGARPRVLLWVAREVGANRSLLNAAEDVQAREALQARARARGMPLQLPLLDLQDQSVITAADVWADYEAAIREASSRYPHDAVVTGRLRQQADGHWLADWTLWYAGHQEKFNTQGENRLQALASGVDATQERLAVRLASPALVAGDLFRISVEGVHTLADYSVLQSLLGAAPDLGAIDVLEADRDRVLIGIRSARDPDTLVQQLAAQPGLRQLPGRGASESMEGDGRGPFAADRYFALLDTGADE